jgi:hypothetical protein
MNLTRIIDIKERIALAETFKPDERDFILQCINAAIEAQRPRVVAVDDPGNYLGRIDFLWAFLSLDDGGEGLMAMPMEGMLAAPMIAADKSRLDGLIPIARQLARVFKKPIRLAKFGTRTDVEIYQP